MTEIKICGLFREEDIDFVNAAKPDYAGFILNFPKSRRNLDPEKAAFLRGRLSDEIRAVTVFVDQTPDTVTEAVRRIRPDVVQLHGSEDEAYIDEIRRRAGLPVWKAFRIREEADLAAALRSGADEVLLDNGYGTGRAFDWNKAADFGRPFILAGGLTPENIPEAVERLRPKILDLSSGVETDYKKDYGKILAAVLAARGQKGKV